MDTGALGDWLAARFGGTGTPAPEPVGGGQSNPTYRLIWAGRPMILRRKPFGTLLPSAHAIDREFRVILALGAAGFPVPEALAYCDDPGVLGAEFYLMAEIEGRVIHDTRMPDLSPADRRATVEALVAALAQLHGIDPGKAGLADFGRPTGYIARQVARWSKQYRASATGEIPEMDRLIDWLPEAVAALPEEVCIVHGDYRLDNAILAPDAPEIRAVIDWELSTLGHPLADLGYFLMPWVFPADLRWGLAESDLEALGIPPLEALAMRYAELTGRAELPPLDLLLAYNLFRMAAIIQGVYRRGLDGNAASDQAVSMGRDVGRLAALGWHYARRAGA